ncbi:hypothetical protein [Actinomadura rupiterrae]|uniref:hypothetical protein n=1 Tax=Actinomadura rupiterrae TaxID=559627 RepID=UPI0020A6195F|nr:hypothetical protein [Actinomadura rupiterrae]MCP2334703.1 hypothetical protein [Actinomadura rupiterrae]
MSAVFEYFAADDDATAAAALELPSLCALGTLEAKGIEPAVQLGTLEALLTGRSYDEVTGDARQAKLVAATPECEAVVVTLSDGLTRALAAGEPELFEKIAEQWAQTDEFDGHSDTEALAVFLEDFCALARQALQCRRRLYCRCVV